MKKQTSIVEKQCQSFHDDDAVKKQTIKNDKEPTIKKYNRSNKIYNRDFTFSEFNDINKFHSFSFESKFSRLNKFCNRLKNCITIKPKKKFRNK